MVLLGEGRRGGPEEEWSAGDEGPLLAWIADM